MKPDAKHYDLLVVGAGPAGMHAALLADEAGLRVAVIDEQAAAGGQIFRQPPASFAAAESSAFASYPFGRDLLAKAKAAQRIDWYFATSAWGRLRMPKAASAWPSTQRMAPASCVLANC